MIFHLSKKLDIGWQRFVYPDRPSSINADIHPGFTPDAALESMDICKAAGIKVGTADKKTWKKVFHGALGRWADTNGGRDIFG